MLGVDPRCLTCSSWVVTGQRLYFSHAGKMSTMSPTTMGEQNHFVVSPGSSHNDKGLDAPPDGPTREHTPENDVGRRQSAVPQVHLAQRFKEQELYISYLEGQNESQQGRIAEQLQTIELRNKTIAQFKRDGHAWDEARDEYNRVVAELNGKLEQHRKRINNLADVENSLRQQVKDQEKAMDEAKAAKAKLASAQSQCSMLFRELDVLRRQISESRTPRG